MLFDYNGQAVQGIKVPCIRQIVKDVAEIFYKQMEDSEQIQMYVFSEDAYDIINLLLEEINVAFICEDEDMLPLTCDFAIISICSDGTIYLEDALANDGYVKEPSELMNYADDELPYYVVADIATYECPVITYGITNTNGDNFDFELFTDEQGKYHGFSIKKPVPNGGTKIASCYSSDELDSKTINEILQIL